jgi:hypothetical protein
MASRPNVVYLDGLNLRIRLEGSTPFFFLLTLEFFLLLLLFYKGKIENWSLGSYMFKITQVKKKKRKKNHFLVFSHFKNTLSISFSAQIDDGVSTPASDSVTCSHVINWTCHTYLFV